MINKKHIALMTLLAACSSLTVQAYHGGWRPNIGFGFSTGGGWGEPGVSLSVGTGGYGPYVAPVVAPAPYYPYYGYGQPYGETVIIRDRDDNYSRRRYYRDDRPVRRSYSTGRRVYTK